MLNHWKKEPAKISFDSRLGGARVVDYEALNAISETISGDHAAFFIYDTSKDSDGGAWRQKCQASSWYRESLNTSTRGATREFPALALITADDAGEVTIYDASTEGLPLWMTFSVSSGYHMHLGVVLNLAALNGRIFVGKDDEGLRIVDFVGDSAEAYKSGGSFHGKASLPIAKRNAVNVWSNDQAALSGADVSGVSLRASGNPGAMGVNAALATSGGLDYLTDAGDIYTITVTGATKYDHVAFAEDGRIGYTADTIAGATRYLRFDDVPTADVVISTAVNVKGSSKEFYVAQGTSATGADAFIMTSENAGGSLVGDAVASDKGLVLLKRNPSTPANGLMCQITDTYNTGYIPMSSELAISDTLAGALDSANEYITNGDFSSGDLSGWTVGDSAGGATTYSAGKCDITNTSGTARLRQLVTLAKGQAYTLSFDVDGPTFPAVYDRDNNLLQASSAGYAGTNTITFVSGRSDDEISFRNFTTGTTVTIDNVSLTDAVANRVDGANSFGVTGSLSRSEVATGAELQELSGFTSSNYARGDLSPDFSGDFSIGGWMKASSGSTLDALYDNGATSGSGGYARIHTLGSGTASFSLSGETSGAVDSQSSSSIADGLFHLVIGVREGSNAKMYVDGALVATVADTTVGGVVNASAVSNVGILGDGGSPHSGDIATTFVAPVSLTPEQIKYMYERDRPRFTENAAETLHGASEAVTALSKDAVTCLVHAGTSTGRSAFQGVSRVEQNDIAVTDAIAASGGLVVQE